MKEAGFHAKHGEKKVISQKSLEQSRSCGDMTSVQDGANLFSFFNVDKSQGLNFARPSASLWQNGFDEVLH